MAAPWRIAARVQREQPMSGSAIVSSSAAQPLGSSPFPRRTARRQPESGPSPSSVAISPQIDAAVAASSVLPATRKRCARSRGGATRGRQDVCSGAPGTREAPGRCPLAGSGQVRHDGEAVSLPARKLATIADMLALPEAQRFHDAGAPSTARAPGLVRPEAAPAGSLDARSSAVRWTSPSPCPGPWPRSRSPCSCDPSPRRAQDRSRTASARGRGRPR